MKTVTLALAVYSAGAVIFYGLAVCYQFRGHISPPPKPPWYGIRPVAIYLWPVIMPLQALVVAAELFLNLVEWADRKMRRWGRR